MVAFPKGRLDCCGEFITFQLYVNQCARKHMHGRNGKREDVMGMNGKEPESLTPNSEGLATRVDHPVVKHNIKSACKIQHLGSCGHRLSAPSFLSFSNNST